RFTYFNEELQSTIHSQTISGLIQTGGSFRELFVPDPPLLSDDESDGDDDWEEDFNPFAPITRPPSVDGTSKSMFTPPPAQPSAATAAPGGENDSVDDAAG